MIHSASVVREPTDRAYPSALAAFADTATFAIVVAATVALPLVISIAGPDVFAAPKTVLAVAFAAVLLALLTVRWAAAGAAWRTSTLAVALAAFVAWNFLAAGLSIDQWHAVVGERLQYQGLAANLAYVVFFVAAFSTIRGERRQTRFLVAVAVAGAVVATYALLQRAGLDPIWSRLPDDRVFSTMGHPTALGAYLAVAFPLVGALAFGRSWRWRVGASAAAVAIAAALAFTLSRGGYLGLAAGAAVLGVGVWRTRAPAITRRGLAVAVMAGVLGVVAIVSVPDVRAVGERVIARALRTTDLGEGSVMMHLDQWTVAAAIVADHPVVGTGQDTYVLVFDRYRDDVLAPDRAAFLSRFRPESAHNVYLQIAAGAGLPALVAYLAIIILSGARTLAGIRSSVLPRARIFGVACLAAVVAHLVTDSFVTGETSSSVLFWVALGAGAALPTARSPELTPAPGPGSED